MVSPDLRFSEWGAAYLPAALLGLALGVRWARICCELKPGQTHYWEIHRRNDEVLVMEIHRKKDPGAIFPCTYRYRFMRRLEGIIGGLEA
jgi:hypothetical protein